MEPEDNEYVDANWPFVYKRYGKYYLSDDDWVDGSYVELSKEEYEKFLDWLKER